MKLKVGDVVAYPPHGVGRVAAREKRVVLGAEQEVVVLSLPDGLSVTLTVERAQDLLRPLVDEDGLRRVQATLRAEDAISDDIWAKRLKEAQEKLRTGDPLGLAEIVRDGVRRERNAPGSPKLSASERALVVKARDLLSGEIGVVRGLDQEAANAWIDEQLAATS